MTSEAEDLTAHKQALERLLNSPEYPELERQLSVNNARFENLKPSVKLLSIYLFKHGGEEVMEDLWRLFYRFRPPTIEEYLGPRYLPETSQILYPQWNSTISKIFDPSKEYFEWLLGGSIGAGKCHRRGERVMLYSGETIAVEDVRPGDRLMGPDSKPRTVLALSRDRGRLYRVETNAGEEFYVNRDHILRVNWNRRTSRRVDGVKKAHYDRQEVNLSLGEILDAPKGRMKFDYKLVKKPVDFPAVPHTLSPYFVGAMLGDGSMSDVPVFYTADPEMESWFKEYAAEFGLEVRQSQSTGCQKLVMSSGARRHNPVLNALKDLGLMGKNWDNKAIPASYKFDSRENRLQLLAGLLDTDGHLQSHSRCFEFASKSKTLAEDVRWLARSLGFHSTLAYKETNSQYVRGNPGYRVHISGHLDTIPTKIARKRAEPRRIKKDPLLHGFRSIEALPEPEEWYGFQLDGDHLYLDDDFFVHHNTSAAIIAHMYNLIKVGSLINPHATLGSAPNKNLILSLFTVTLPKARKALVEPFKNLMIECSEVFEEVDRKEYEAGFPSYDGSEMIPFYDAKNELILPRSISVMLGSQTSHALSFDMFGAFLDEAEFRAGSVDKAFEVYSSLRERVRSRFLGSRFTLVTLVSSARYSTGIISQYTANIAPDDKHTIYSAYPIWEIKSFNAYKDGHFYVLRGNSNHPSRILDDDYAAIEAGTYVKPEGCEVIKVPLTYYKDFSLRIEEAIRNLAGMQTMGADHPFAETSQIVDKSLVAEFKISAPLGEGIPLINKLPAGLFMQTPNGRRLKRYPSAKRYCHIDLAEVNVAGITIVHKELHGDKTIYVADLTCEIVSPTKIDLNAVKRLIKDLSREAGVEFRVVSADQYQSAAMRQELEVEKIAQEVKLLSVDRNLWPIGEMSRIVANGQFKTGESPNLQAQMREVTIASVAPLVRRGSAGKDQLDSAIGAVINAVEDLESPAVYPYITSSVEDVASQTRARAFTNLDLL